MKKIILITAAILAYCILDTANCFSQGTAINSNGANPDNSAILDAASTTKGFLLPRMTTTERNNIVSPAQSLLIFNTTTTCFEYHYSGVWYSMSCTCTVPFAPTANTATNVTDTSFTANWTASSGATTYYLDVATDTAFAAFVPGYNNLNVGNVQTQGIASLQCNTTYYYRVRANNACGTSSNSNTVSATTSACFVCGTSTVDFTYKGGGVTYGTVESNTSPKRCWLDRNLGASQVPTSSTDAAGYGDLFQWGRPDDGHQTRTTPTTTSLSSTDVPGHSDFIIRDMPGDWRDPPKDTLWKGVNGINNPCPSGWRIPTVAELQAEMATWSPQNATGAYSSPLKFPLAGHRFFSHGGLCNEGTYSFLWSSDISNFYAQTIWFNTSQVTYSPNETRANGFSVRCIKN